jgi:hypothetical protein
VPRGISSSCVIVMSSVLALARVGGAQPAAPPPAPAPQVEAAVAQYERGRALMKAKHYAEACDAFAQSQKLDPGWGTLYNLARCYELIGKLASARATFRELARLDTYPALAAEIKPERDLARRKDAGSRASALDKRVPGLRLTSSSAPAGLLVTLDGVDVTSLLGTDHPVDLGAHKVHASAPDRKDFDATTTITDEGKTVAIAIELLPADESGPVAAPRAANATPEASGSPTAVVGTESPPADTTKLTGPDGPDTAPPGRRRTYGVILATGGGALVVTGLVFGALARSKWSEAEDACAEHICSNARALNEGLVSDARSRATISTALVIGGAAAVGAGVVLFLTAPSRAHTTSTALRVTPSASPGVVSLVVDGRF